jgi:hypothetical protein
MDGADDELLALYDATMMQRTGRVGGGGGGGGGGGAPPPGMGVGMPYGAAAVQRGAAAPPEPVAAPHPGAPPHAGAPPPPAGVGAKRDAPWQQPEGGRCGLPARCCCGARRARVPSFVFARVP